MKAKIKCQLFYSTNGLPFRICDRNIDPNVNRAYVSVLLSQIHQELKQDESKSFSYVNEQPDETISVSYDKIMNHHTHNDILRLIINNDIPISEYFTSETLGILVNEKNQILRIGSKYKLPLHIYRSVSDPNKLRVFLNNKINADTISWISI